MTKCRGFCFKASIKRLTCEGKIQVENGYVYLCQNIIDGAVCHDRLGFKYSWCIIDGSKEDMTMTHVTDFEIVPRDPETYKDWQVGDTIEYGDNYSTGRIIFRGGDLVAADIEGTCNYYTCDELFNEEYRLVLTDIEQQIIEERKKAEWEPQDGDVCYAENIDGYCTPFIYRHTGLNRTAFYAAFDKWGNVLIYHGNAISKETMKMLRPATEEERQKLFDAMANEGKRWNAEKKVVEDIPKPHEFKKGEPVLVRDDNESLWILGSFIQFIPTTCFHVTNGVRPSHWKQCLPYNERTMHLLGTAEDYKEE